MDKLFEELSMLRDIALAQHQQLNLMQSALLPEQQEAISRAMQQKERRHLAEQSGDDAASGVRILHEKAMIALGPSGDVVLSRVGAGRAHVTNTTSFDKIRVNSTDDILIGDCTLTEVLTNDCDTSVARDTTTTTTSAAPTTPLSVDVHASCLQILINHPAAAGKDGTYTLVDDSGDEYDAWCDMTTDGGGWTLAAKMTNADEKNWVTGGGAWANATAYGNTSDLSDGSDARGAAWGSVPAAQIMLRDSENGYDYLMTEAASGCFLTETVSTTEAARPGTSRSGEDNVHATMAQYWARAMVDFPGYGLADTDTCHYFERCAATGTYNPAFLVSGDAFSQTEIGSGDIQYLTMAFSDRNADTSGVISGLESANYCPEADIAIGALEQGDAWLAGATNKGHQQDIGGPSECNYNDALCASDYPETVFFFVREEAEELCVRLGCHHAWRGGPW